MTNLFFGWLPEKPRFEGNWRGRQVLLSVGRCQAFGFGFGRIGTFDDISRNRGR